MHLGDHAIIDVECYEDALKAIKRCRRVLFFCCVFIGNKGDKKSISISESISESISISAYFSLSGLLSEWVIFWLSFGYLLVSAGL